MSSSFESAALEFFRREGNLNLSRPFPLIIGFGPSRKAHRFDLGSQQPALLVECKRHTWTKSGNPPSAKMSVWNEAMLYFSLVPSTCRRILFVKKSMVNNRSLAQYYVDNYAHLIPPAVEVWEFDVDCFVGTRVCPSTIPEQSVDATVSSDRTVQLPTVASGARKYSVHDFKNAIIRLFVDAQENDQKTVTIRAGDVHYRVVGSRSTPNRMSNSCSAMYSLYDPTRDKIVCKPRKGKGANLVMEHALPR